MDLDGVVRPANSTVGGSAAASASAAGGSGGGRWGLINGGSHLV